MLDITWFVNIAVLIAASGIDCFTRRIPNWLTLPFLASGLVYQTVSGGWRGFGGSLAGIAVALLVFGLPCFLKGMGMGDLKLAGGVGAWVGPSQALFAFLIAAVAGGVIAIVYAAAKRSLFGDAVPLSPVSGAGACTQSARAASALAIPYGPAIAVGTLFSFFAK